MGSEALFIYDLTQQHNVYYLLIFATVGNVLGAVLNYWLGLKGEKVLLEKKIFTHTKLEKGKKFFTKYGSFAILLTWVPLVGDTFTFIAGLLKYDFKKFILLTIISKGGRYIVLALIYFNFF